MNQVPANLQMRFIPIAGQCLEYGAGLGLILGGLYGIVVGLMVDLLLGMIFGAIFGLIIGMFVGSIGGLLLAMEIYCWRRWLSPRNLGEQNLYWLAPSSISLSYFGLWYKVLLNDDHYQQHPLAGLLEVETLGYAIGPSLIIAITIRLILPKLLDSQPAQSSEIKRL
ncbi:hypothetical protein [Herpetosiphon geysericola]|uniref:Uncharacterized protein n=1 Tax=Herpetosiphon geysericola TaxID=70996 RepID=A0A0P6YLI6_9CHLR|nr:hypothetical protein [Herpetosiphon geysericola]KPL86118.1 hypothetical protein SE18_14715 [Herpetosiphon geysericola]